MTPFYRRRKANSLKPSATNRGFCYSQVLTATVSLLGAGLVGGRHWALIHYPDRANFGQLAFDFSLATLDSGSLGKEPARILNKQKLVRTRGYFSPGPVF